MYHLYVHIALFATALSIPTLKFRIMFHFQISEVSGLVAMALQEMKIVSNGWTVQLFPLAMPTGTQSTRNPGQIV